MGWNEEGARGGCSCFFPVRGMCAYKTILRRLKTKEGGRKEKILTQEDGLIKAHLCKALRMKNCQHSGIRVEGTRSPPFASLPFLL